MEVIPAEKNASEGKRENANLRMEANYRWEWKVHIDKQPFTLYRIWDNHVKKYQLQDKFEKNTKIYFVTKGGSEVLLYFRLYQGMFMR